MTTSTALRSVLYVPGDKERALQKLGTLAADVFVIDLEDAVAPERKDGARANTAAVLKAGEINTAKLVVRVNGDAASQSADEGGVSAAVAEALQAHTQEVKK